jgi:hypothetical protein
LRRAPESQLRERFLAFDEAWHHLAHDLADHDYLNASWLRREADAIAQNDHALHQMLRVGSAPLYDRVRVAALTRQLADATSHLLEDVKYEDEDDPQWETVSRRVQRVQRLAADLHQAVAQNAPLNTIVDEYEEFDQTWHRLRAAAQQLPDIDRHLWKIGRRIDAIDVELHRELQVNSPVTIDPAQLRQLANSVARQAEHLEDDLRYGLGDRDRDAQRIADDFAAAARDLQRAVSTPERDEAEAAQRAQRYWNTLAKRIKQLPNQDHAQQMAAALGEDLNRLVAMLGQNG